MSSLGVSVGSRFSGVFYICLTAAACGGPSGSQVPPRAAAELIEGSRPAMGAELRLTVWTNDRSTTTAAFEEVFAEFARLERLMSTWVDNSDVQHVNQAAGASPVAVRVEVRDVLDKARQ